MKIRQHILILIIHTFLLFVFINVFSQSQTRQKKKFFISGSCLFIEKIVDQEDFLINENDLSDFLVTSFTGDSRNPLVVKRNKFFIIKYEKIVPKSFLIDLYLDIPPPFYG